MHYISNILHGDISIKSNNIKGSKENTNGNFDSNDISGMTINGQTFNIKNITGYSKEIMKLTGHLKTLKSASEDVKIPEIKAPEIKTPETKITGYRGSINNNTGNIKPNTNSINLWDMIKSKIQQVIPFVRQFKQQIQQVGGSKELELVKYKISEVEEKLENAKEGKIHLNTKEIIEAEAELERLNNKKDKLEKGGKGNFFSSFFSSLKKITPSMNNISGITIKIRNQIKQWNGGIKNGLGHVLKYATALFSLRSIYSALSSSAQAWLGSQNKGAQQLSANIEYMKYAMGSVFAPVIQYVTSLVYQLMKAIQSVVYAMSGVNIFAKTTASSMKNTSSSAKQASKSLSSVHSEINNVSDNKNNENSSSNPNIDLSKMDSNSNPIIDAIKQGNWYQVGETIGKKINEAINSIPWDKIQNTAKKIGTNIAQFLNGGIKETDWNKVGNAFAQGLNTIIYFGYNFVTNFDWKQFGKAIGDSINGFFNNVDWSVAAKTLSEGIKGTLDTISTTLETIDWQQIARDVEEFIKNIDWSGVVSAIFKGIGTALGGLALFLGTLISDAFNGIEDYFNDKIEECGGNVVAGIFKGIGDAIVGVGQWVYDNIFVPFIDGFKNAFGIHSPSTVMEEQGNFIVEGLKNGLLGIWDKVKQPFVEFKNNVTNKLTEIKGNISNWSSNTKTTISNWGNDVKNKISLTWSNASQNVNNSVNTLKNNISTGLNSAKSTISNWGDSIKNTFSNLGRNASTWGKDLVSNMASGIKNNIHKVTSAVNSVANKIKSLLGFSEPEDGPLSNFHTYMPDMIDLMVSGIKANTNKVKSEIENLANMMSYTINTDSITRFNPIQPKIEPINIQPSNIANTFEDVLSDFASLDNNDRQINLTINVGNKKLGQILLDDLRDKTRRTGKDIEALIGG
jgi:hypothetical protein